MIPPSLRNIKSIVTIIPFSFFALILFLRFNFTFSLSNSSHPFNKLDHSLTMPGKRNLSLSPPSFSLSSSDNSPTAMVPLNKKLRRLPHIFSKVLELPFDSDADVAVEDRRDCLRFIADGVNGVAGDVRTHVVEVHPGVTKVVIRMRESNIRSCYQPLVDHMELNLWRFRLPDAARPELAKAAYGGGRLVVTVPKHGHGRGEMNSCSEDCKGGDFRGNNMGNLLVV